MSSVKPEKILFITPPYHCGIAEVIGRWIPLGLVYLAGAARQAGFTPEIYDAMAKGVGYPQIKQQIIKSNPAYLATSAMTASINDALKIMELAKQINPETVTILGGIHPTFMYAELLNSSAIDYIIIGEGDATLAELLQTLSSDGEPATVQGVAFRRGDKIVKTAQRELISELDSLEPAWELLDWNDYKYLLIPDSKMASISTSRGCEYNCSFCSQHKFWGASWRARQPESILKELQKLHHKFAVNVVMITDEHPTRDRVRWEKLLDLLIAEKLPVYLLMETRGDDIIRDQDIIAKYHQAGIIHISIGIDAPQQARLDTLGKQANLEKLKQALALIKKHGIVSDASFILGFPDETPESIKNLVRFVQHCNPDNANFLPLTPWPYSDIYKELKTNIKVLDYSKYNLVDAIIKPEAMTLAELEMSIADCFRKFYMGKIIDVMTMKDTFKRGYLLRASKLFMSSPFILGKLKMGIMGKLLGK